MLYLMTHKCPLGGTADTVDLESTAMSMRVRISQGVLKKFSNMKKKLDEIANAESHESFWEINNIEEEGRLELLFFPIENPKDIEESNTHLTIKVNRKQLDDLFEFCERMNKVVK